MKVHGAADNSNDQHSTILNLVCQAFLFINMTLKYFFLIKKKQTKFSKEMTRGYSLEQDLRLLINNPKYSDIEILCEDEKKLHGCRAILAARSEVFDKLLYNGMKESYENQISFPKINSSGMEIILEYIYTGSIKEESLTKDNTIEAFNAADYFQLPNLQGFIMKILKNNIKKDSTENYLPELLSKAVDTVVLQCTNQICNQSFIFKSKFFEMELLKKKIFFLYFRNDERIFIRTRLKIINK